MSSHAIVSTAPTQTEETVKAETQEAHAAEIRRPRENRPLFSRAGREASRKLTLSVRAIALVGRPITLLPSIVFSAESLITFLPLSLLSSRRQFPLPQVSNNIAMKLITNLFGSSSAKQEKSKRRISKKKGNKNSSFGSTTSSDESSSSTTTPRSVLPPPPLAVTREELEAALRSIVASKAELAEMLADEAEASAVLEGVATAAADEGELKETFAVFDADGDGRISAEELRAVLASLGDEPCSVEDCRRMIRGVDTDGDGFVCFKEFTRMMMQTAV
ncbi:hypothetical protein PR202_gb16470 [Eleusine coracana subsp. coracana]|uniref:EF-hand domain-containing protein n=1 Tax=Eleusine coracana subsp. coracana TaxID=191504 RepID=A0AAV5EY74_ELECO|nr:hypothetical protein PR202_gb16470 [Eleusine coracana subsp. coracana]